MTVAVTATLAITRLPSNSNSNIFAAQNTFNITINASENDTAGFGLQVSDPSV